MAGLKREEIHPSSIGYVAISHLHGDHFGGIPFLVLDGQFSRRERPLVIGGPPGIQERVVAAMEVLFPGSSTAKRRFETEFVEFAPGARTPFGPANILAAEVDHTSGAPSLGLRIEYGRRIIAYSGDTAWTDTLADLATGANVFICEAYYYDKAVPFHLDYAMLRANAGRLGCERIVLTHMSAGMLARIEETGVEVAHDGLVLEV
jgi:ribonuclease BN (tRNA processing enzyme)